MYSYKEFKGSALVMFG